MVTRRTIVLVASLGAVACGGLDPTGEHEGTLARSSQTTTMLTDLAPDGTSTASNSSSTGSQTGVIARVTRVGERQLEIALGDVCRFRVEQSPEPNDHNARVAIDQRCSVELEGFRGEVPVDGFVQLGRDQEPLTIEITLNGSENRGDPNRAGFVTASFTYTYRGTRRSS